MDWVLAEELTRTRADLEALRRTAVSDTLAGEIRFAAEFSGMLRELAEGGAKAAFGPEQTDGRAADPVAALARVLRVFGCEVRT